MGSVAADRTGLILDIFARRARSAEGKLEVEKGAHITADLFTTDDGSGATSVSLTLHFEDPSTPDLILPDAVSVPRGRSVSTRASSRSVFMSDSPLVSCSGREGR